MLKGFKNKTISKMFFKYFELSVAQTKQDLHKAQRIRHAVYQSEKGWEPKDSNARDVCPLDNDSVHILVKSISLNRHIGTIRLCINKSHNHLHFKDLYEDQEIDHSFVDLSDETDSVFCEISRLCIIPAHRKSSKNGDDLSDTLPAHEKKLFRAVSLALLSASLVVIERLNLKAAVFLTDKKVAKLVKREGITFHKIGDEKELNGKRTLYVIRDCDIAQFKKLNSLSTHLLRLLEDKITLKQPLIPVFEYNSRTSNHDKK